MLISSVLIPLLAASKRTLWERKQKQLATSSGCSSIAPYLNVRTHRIAVDPKSVRSSRRRFCVDVDLGHDGCCFLVLEE